LFVFRKPPILPLGIGRLIGHPVGVKVKIQATQAWEKTEFIHWCPQAVNCKNYHHANSDITFAL
jgi:hypothetical protein